MKTIHRLVLKAAFLFAIFVFLLTLIIGYFSLIPLMTLFYRGAIAFLAAGFIGLIVFKIIENTIKEALIIIQEREEERRLRRAREKKKRDELRY